MFGKWIRRRLSGEQQAKAIITALYRSLLLRDPDEAGLAAQSNALRNSLNTAAIESIIDGFVQSEEFYQRRGLFVLRHMGHRPDAFLADLTQNGEMFKLFGAMIDATCAQRIVVEVGVHELIGSNSHDLMRWFGWHGLLIEANSSLNAQIHREFGALHYKLVNVAVSNFSGSAELHLGITDGVTSLNATHAERFGPTRGSVTVQVERLQTILQREGIPHRFGLLSIDIEGEDITVLNDLIGQSHYRPDWIIFETGQIERYRPGALPLVPEFDREYAWAAATKQNQIFRLRAK